MSKKIPVQGYINSELWDEMEAYRKTKGMNRSTFLAQAVGLYLAEGEVEPSNTDIRIVGNRKYEKGVTKSGKVTWRLIVNKQALDVND